jgi:LysM repeat protein
MAGRSPLRFLAPIALVAFAVALYTVVHDAGGPAGTSSSDTPMRSGTPSGVKTAGAKKAAKRKRRTYVVKSGDTASGIAEKTGVSISTMQKLNKDFNPQTLAPGQRIRLVQ